mmetsp:Transcript_132874/g.187711  ORF Transcript_132874/g.187711 Transcript_132874/m.187711 type:complete len:189 (-) Transcript_132874:173-739(-)
MAEMARASLQRAPTMRARVRSSCVEAEFYDDVAIGWNELFEETAPAAGRVRDSPSGLPAPPLPAKRKARPPPYLRMGGGKKNAIEHGIKERLRFCPINQIRKPAEIVDLELDQLRSQLGAEHGRRRKEMRQLRRLRRRCRLQPHEDLDEVEEQCLVKGKLKPLEAAAEGLRSARTPRRPDPPKLRVGW